MQILEQKENGEARLIQTEQGTPTNRSGSPNFESEVKLLCYLRERRRIIDLANILERRESIQTQDQSE